MKNITKNKYQFVESKYKFNNSKKSIEIESECFKEFFPYINITLKNCCNKKLYIKKIVFFF